MIADISLIAIVGPTASGKTSFAIELAQQYNGEIIAADSRTVYRGLDIGTAKPTMAERKDIPHWGFDLVGPGEGFSVADFQRYAQATITDITARGRLPIIVGGTGLYVDTVLYDYKLVPADNDVRNRFKSLGVLELQKLIRQKGYPMPENSMNKRYLLRTLERGGMEGVKSELLPGAIIIGLAPNREELLKRIEARAEKMFNDGVLNEVEWALQNYSSESAALTGGIYRIFRDAGGCDMPKEDVIKKCIQSDMRLAKRQFAWFKRNADIMWFENSFDANTWFCMR